jgi:hypothetical protein
MKQFKFSVLAVLVASAVTVSTLPVAANDQNDIQLKNQATVFASKDVPTVSGMSNQVDSVSGQTTFAWAPVGVAVPNMSAVAPEHQLAFAAEHYLNVLTGAVSKGGLVGLKPTLVSSHMSDDGVKIAKFTQEFAGIEVFNKEYNVLMDAEFNLVAGSGGLSSAAAAPKVSALSAFAKADNAVLNAFVAAGGNENDVILNALESDGKYQQFAVAEQQGSVKLIGEPRAKPVFFEKKSKLIPAHYVEIEVAAEDAVDSEYYSYVISSETGEVLFKNNLKAHAADFEYRIYADSNGRPWDGPHGNVIPAAGPEQDDATTYLDAPLVKLLHGPISKKDPWLLESATNTIGNNVNAYADVVAPDGFTNGDYNAEITGPKTFDYKYRTSEPETSMNNRKAAIVNLFYMNNYLHDMFYDYGFNEAAGNAQALNYGRGGVEGDPIRAEVQDNSGFNNANMSTPADGRSPRMQMYLWDSKDAVFGKDYGVKAAAGGEEIAITQMQRSSFGVGQFNISGELALFDDGVPATRDACEPAINGAALAGKIAVLDRGTCNFTVKVKNAQNAGAIGVVVVNHLPTGLPSMGGDDATVKIPNVGITQAEGAKLYAALQAGKTVNIEMFNKKPYKDSSWDNAIVSHEWGHYISNRLVGNGSGLYNNQGRSMGEGWGDFHALMMISEAKDLELPGNDKLQRAYAAITYVDSFYYGIRSVPYSQDREVNGKSFQNIEVGKGVVVDSRTGNAQVHSAGEVWATVLWDGFVNLVNDDRHSFDEAKHRMLGYLVNGYKMTPVGPTYTEARDAILAAAYAKDPADYKLLLKAFADRGMGLGAVSPARDNGKHTGVVESNKTELSTFEVSSHSLDRDYEGATTGFCTNNGILDNGETGTVSFNFLNRGSSALTNVKAKVEVTSGQTVTFANNGEFTLPKLDVLKTTASTPLEFKLEGAETADTLSFKVSFPGLAEGVITEEYELSDLVNLNFKDQAPVNQQSIDNMETYASLNNFKEVVLAGGAQAEGSRLLDDVNAEFFVSQGHPVGSQVMFIANNGFTSDVAYETQAFEVGYGGDFVLDFWHYFWFEDKYDGGVVEVSVNGGAWVDAAKIQVGTTSAGAPIYPKFKVGYTAELDELLPGRTTYTGNMNAQFGGVESINFGPGLNGNQVKFRFRAVSDSNSNEFGWFIDNVQVKNITTAVFSDVVAGDTFACDNRVPVITSAAAASVAAVNEGGTAKLTVAARDANAADKLTYSWVQTSGSKATITNGNTAEATVTAPQVTASETLGFEVTVSDGKDSVKSAVSLKVTNVPATPPKKSSGSFGWMALLMLPLALLRRRKA